MLASVSNLRAILGDGVLASAAIASRGSPDPSTRFGFAEFMRCVSATLSRDTHVFQVDHSALIGLASGFCCSVLSLLHFEKQVLWISQRLSTGEGGALFGPGLLEMGLDPGRLVFVEVASSSDVLWAVEEGLRSRAVGAVVGELVSDGRCLDLTATRRLALRSHRSGVPAYLVALGGDLGPTAARTRWRVSGAPSRQTRGPALLGHPAWTLDLVRNRDGACGRQVVGFVPSERRFVEVEDGTRQSRAAATFRPAGPRPPSAQVGSLVVPFNATRRLVDEADRR